jgi:ethanolamine utilization protein EutP (predicted NTPase)
LELKSGATNVTKTQLAATHHMADSHDHTAGAGTETVFEIDYQDNCSIRFSRARAAISPYHTIAALLRTCAQKDEMPV